MNAVELITGLRVGKHDESLIGIYTSGGLQQAKARYIKLLQDLTTRFGPCRDICLLSAPGRTEVGGNHTDHNRGQVLAAAVNLDVIAVASPSHNKLIVIHSEGFDPIELDIDHLAPVPSEEGTPAGIIRGIASGCIRRGLDVGGFNACISSQVPKGSGLSSSAAFEVLICAIFDHLFNLGKLDPIQAALIGQYAENKYFGKPCGLMDQTASAVGGFVAINFKYEDEPKVEKIDFNFAESGLDLCIVNTKGSHHDLTDAYAAIPEEMKAVAAQLGCSVLAETSRDKLLEKLSAIREICGDRAVLRALHFFDENDRAVQQARALEQGDVTLFLKLVRESGRSSLAYLQNVFATTRPAEQGVTLGLYLSDRFLKDAGAYRVHGGGFAGTIQAFVPRAMTSAYQSLMDAAFGEDSCHVLSIRRAGGVRV